MASTTAPVPSLVTLPVEITNTIIGELLEQRPVAAVWLAETSEYFHNLVESATIQEMSNLCGQPNDCYKCYHKKRLWICNYLGVRYDAQDQGAMLLVLIKGIRIDRLVMAWELRFWNPYLQHDWPELTTASEREKAGLW